MKKFDTIVKEVKKENQDATGCNLKYKCLNRYEHLLEDEFLKSVKDENLLFIIDCENNTRRAEALDDYSICYINDDRMNSKRHLVQIYFNSVKMTNPSESVVKLTLSKTEYAWMQDVGYNFDIDGLSITPNARRVHKDETVILRHYWINTPIDSVLTTIKAVLKMKDAMLHSKQEAQKMDVKEAMKNA